MELEKPAGLVLQPDFITPAHEASLIRIFRTQLAWPARSSADSRRSLNYGRPFCYRTLGVDAAAAPVPFPDWLRPLVPEIDGRQPDQVCLQHYPPGAGIPPHADTHSVFGDELCALSLGTAVVMQFRRHRRAEDGEGAATAADLDLPPRSMLRMRRDARLHWTHAIAKRKTDRLPDGTVRRRGDRWSITYRWLRDEGECGGRECGCGDVQLCDSAQRRIGIEKEFRWNAAAPSAGRPSLGEAGGEEEGGKKRGGEEGEARMGGEEAEARTGQEGGDRDGAGANEQRRLGSGRDMESSALRTCGPEATAPPPDSSQLTAPT